MFVWSISITSTSISVGRCMLAATLSGESASLGLKRSGLAAASINLTKPTVCASAQMCKRIRIPKHVVKKNIKSSKRDRRSREVVGPKLSHPRATHVCCRLPRRPTHALPLAETHSSGTKLLRPCSMDQNHLPEAASRRQARCGQDASDWKTADSSRNHVQ